MQLVDTFRRGTTFGSGAPADGPGILAHSAGYIAGEGTPGHRGAVLGLMHSFVNGKSPAVVLVMALCRGSWLVAC